MKKVYFASIDAKDDLYTHYDCVSFNTEDCTLHLGEKNYRLQLEAQREYLTRLKRLQDEIAEKYQPLIDQGEEVGRMEIEEYKIFAKELDIKYPGEEASYYT